MMTCLRRKILVVDDEQDIIQTLRMFLELEGYEVATAMDGEDALNMVHLLSPDLVVLDMMLPVMNGDELVSIVKNDEKLKNIPVILITAFAQKRNEEIMSNAGVDFYLKKPFELDQLNNKIKELLG